MIINEASFYAEIARRLKARRLELGLKQHDVARGVGIERTTLAHIEAARQKPPLHVFYLLCDELHVEPAYLIPSWSEVTDQAIVEEDPHVHLVGLGRPRLTPLLSSFLRIAKAMDQTPPAYCKNEEESNCHE